MTARSLVIVVAWLAAIALGWSPIPIASGLLAADPVLSTVGTFSWLLAFACVALVVTVYACVGAYLSFRRAGGRIGLVLLLGAVLVAITFASFVLGGWISMTRGAVDPLASWLSLLGNLTIYPAILVAGPALAILVPDGRLPGPRWQWGVAAIVGMYAVGSALLIGRPGLVGNALGTNPLGAIGLPWSPELSDVGQAIAAATIPLALALGVGSVVVRFRRSGFEGREQLKWFVAANVVLAVLMVASVADGATQPTSFDYAAFVSLSFPAIAIAVAVLRYRLYEIDRIISRTLSWAVVTGILVAAFAILVVGLQALLANVTQGQTLAVAASTLVAFALFQPVRQRVQRAVDRRFDRARYDGQLTAAAFAERLRTEVDLDSVTSDLTRSVQGALRPRALGIWLKESGR